MFVTLRQVAHRFDDGPVLFQGLDITMEPGHTFALCGPSGCGKSTLLSILAGWVVPWHGRIERQGVARIGWVFQNPYGVPARTALDHVVFPLLSHGMKREHHMIQGRARRHPVRILEHPPDASDTLAFDTSMPRHHPAGEGG